MNNSKGTRLFEELERDLKAKVEAAKNILDNIPNQSGETKKAAIQRVARIADDAKDLVNQLSIELKNQSGSSRSTFDAVVRFMRSEVDSIQTQLLNASDI
ncbi:hypothetical protein SARC_13677 [Sphaeroforma arctica JP610]|uniref:Vesicle transport v-SNARE N-terminal domain-containing protein n=1 Tax=Sphaeroforma arctica JP610 TaxID=667725 RepID=A0A0L0FB88_9EUKA|nr:hypothetical protein SARC_13677 [Sphaeroforma arctica JP610]KNC73766.1 hypothetical protein SARC_13677 [Sphaeroforma arctica JP610]|eukprot:XP_014147668.1 hypothetical protein SARC_13677 [Sphaeroforma arctica JP610]